MSDAGRRYVMQGSYDRGPWREYTYSNSLEKARESRDQHELAYAGESFRWRVYDRETYRVID